MKLAILSFVFLAAASPLLAQSVYLRTPNTGFCRVTAASNATPVRLTVSGVSNCGITTNGQTILVTEVRGNTAANIHLHDASDTVNLARKVANLSANSFDLQDLAGNPVPGNGTYINGGRVGLATQYSLNSHPRLYLDGQGGSLLPSISSTATGGRAHPSNPTFTALKNASTLWGSNWGDDRSGAHGVADALRWLADGDTGAKARALASVTNPDQVLPTLACNESQQQCGAPASSFADYPTQYMEQFAQTYSIMRGEMSAAERTRFANFALNDLSWTQGGVGYTGTSLVKPTWKVKDMATSGTITLSGATVTGTGTHFLTDVAVGDIMVLPNSAESVFAQGWRVAAVNSDTSVTFTAPPDGLQGGSHYMVGPAWNDTMYGLLWYSKHFNFGLACGGAASIFTGSLADCSSTYGADAAIYQVADNNLVLSRLMGYYDIGLATCGDDPRGCLLLELANEWFIDLALPRNLSIWTGFSQSSPGYHTGRLYNLIMQLDLVTRNSFVSAPNYLEGTKIIANGLKWGYGAVLPTFNYTPISERDFLGINAVSVHMPLIGLASAPSSIEARYYRDFLTNKVNYDQNFIRYNNGEYTWHHFLFNDPAIPTTTPPTTFLFDSTDYAHCLAIYGASNCLSTEGRYYATSNQNWSAGRSFVGFNASTYNCLDHCSDDLGGWMLLAKGNKILLSADSDNHMGAREHRGYVQIGGNLTTNLANYPTIGSVFVHWMAGDDSYMVANTNITATYAAAANASAVHKQVIHLKSGSQDYVIDHLKVETSSETQVHGYQHFFLSECGTAASTSCIAMDRASATVSNTQPGAKLVSTAVGIGGGILIDTATGSQTNGSYPGGNGRTFRWAVCPSSNGTSCTNATSTEWAVVHMLSTSSGATMPTIAQSTSGNYRVVEIRDPASPKVAVFTAGGVTGTSLSFTTAHAGTAQYVISGLAPGPYSVSRNGEPVGLRLAGVHRNSISFESASGSISIVPGPPPLSIVTQTLPNAVRTKTYTTNIVAASSTTPYTWTLTSGAMCPGLSFSQSGNFGVVSGSATSLGSCTFTVRVVNSDSTEESSKQFTLTVVEPATQPVTISTTRLPTGRLGDLYVFKMRATGGTLPLSWSVTSGALCPGLTLNAQSGEIRGTPTVLGQCNLTIRATDLGFEYSELSYFITIIVNKQAGLAITTARASQSGAVVQFGSRGLDFTQPCSLELRLGSPSGSVLSVISSPEGPSRRIVGLTGLPAGQNIHATATCGPDTATADFTTGFTPSSPRSAALWFGPPRAGATELLLNYGDTQALSNSLTVPCAAGCTATMPADDPLLYWRARFRDPSAVPIAASDVHRIAPR